MTIQPLTDAELALDEGDESQALVQLKISYRALRSAYEVQGADLLAAQAAIGLLNMPDDEGRTHHHQTCRDPDCTGCKK